MHTQREGETVGQTERERWADGQTERERDGRSERQRGTFTRSHNVLSRKHIPFQSYGNNVIEVTTPFYLFTYPKTSRVSDVS